MTAKKNNIHLGETMNDEAGTCELVKGSNILYGYIKIVRKVPNF